MRRRPCSPLLPRRATCRSVDRPGGDIQFTFDPDEPFFALLEEGVTYQITIHPLPPEEPCAAQDPSQT